MENGPLISVVVPLYNYRKYIGYCIRSILNQTYHNFELIVVDDCSTDSSYKEALKFEKKDKRVKVIGLKKNYGYSKAKNEGIVRSKGRYIVTLDADDMMTKKSLEIRLKLFLKHDIQFVYADTVKIFGPLNLDQCYKINPEKLKRAGKTPTAVYENSIDLYNIHAQSVMMKREVHMEYGLYDEDLRARSDREMWWRLFGKSIKDKPKIKSYYLNKPVAYYRYHRYSMWRKRKRKPSYDKEVIRKSEKAYRMRQKEGITKKNTRFLDK